MIELREEQKGAVDLILPHLSAGSECFFYSPSGSGKTIIMMEVARAKGKTVYVTARRELAEQATMIAAKVGADIEACHPAAVVSGLHPPDPKLIILDETMIGRHWGKRISKRFTEAGVPVIFVH